MDNIGLISQIEYESIHRVFSDIRYERKEQLAKLANNEIRVNLFRGVPPERKLLFLIEELGEVGKAVRGLYIQQFGDERYISDIGELYTELIQLATHVVIWAAGMEYGNG